MKVLKIVLAATAVGTAAVIVYFSGVRFTFGSAVSFHDNCPTGKPVLVESIPTDFTSSDVIYENKEGDRYGYGRMYHILGTYYVETIMEDGFLTKNQPFVILEPLLRNRYLTVIFTRDPRIRYVSIGTEDRFAPNDYYRRLTVETVRQKPDVFRLKTVKNGSAVFNVEMKGSIESQKESYYRGIFVVGFGADGKPLADAAGLKYGEYIR